MATYTYFGYKLSEAFMIKTFINASFINNLKEFVWESNKDYFEKTSEELSNTHHLKCLIQDYFNGDFFTLGDDTSPVHLMAYKCCRSDRIASWILGVRVEAEGMEVDTEDSNDSPEVSPEDKAKLLEIGEFYHLEMEPDYYTINVTCVNTKFIQL